MLKIQVAQRTRKKNRINIKNPTKHTKQNTPRHIIFKLMKTKDKNEPLTVAREIRYITWRGTKIRLAAHFSLETNKTEDNVMTSSKC